MRFLKFINEFNFKNARDIDYPAGTRKVITFRENEPYVIRGKAHDLRSHAIKHLSQFDESYMSKMVKDAVNVITNYDYWVKNGERDLFRHSIDKVEVINTFDMINDKIHFGEELLEPEEKLKFIIKKISNRYEEIISHFIRNSNYIGPDSSKHEIEGLVLNKSKIKFDVVEDNSNMIHYLDLMNMAFMVEYKNNIKTLYILDNISSGKDSIGQRYRRKRVDIQNKDLARALGVE